MSIVPVSPHPPRLREQVRASARNLPGIYRMVAEDGEILYVGKSKQVRTRLLSYFRAKDGEKAKRIIEQAHGLEWEYAPSEFAALLQELKLIKRFRPRFNVRHKRDALYSFLKLTAGPAPKLFVVRHVVDDAATYFGPFRGGRRIAEAVRELNDVLGLRDCSLSTPMHFADQSDLFQVELSPRCHRYELKRCAAPCAGLCSQSGYQRLVDLARAFLVGDADEPLRWIAERMEAAAQRWDFEHAAALRDRARRLEMLRDEFARLREAVEALSFVYHVPGVGADDRVYVVRRGTIRAELPAPDGPDGVREVERVVQAVFRDPEPGGALVSKHQVDEILLLAQWFRLRPHELARTRPASRATPLTRSA